MGLRLGIATHARRRRLFDEDTDPINRGERDIPPRTQARDKLAIIHGHSAKCSLGHSPMQQERLDLGKQLLLGCHGRMVMGQVPFRQGELWATSPLPLSWALWD